MAQQEIYTHVAFIACAAPGCGGAGSVRSQVTGKPGEAVTVVSEGTCGGRDRHKLAEVKQIQIPE